MEECVDVTTKGLLAFGILKLGPLGPLVPPDPLIPLAPPGPLEPPLDPLLVPAGSLQLVAGLLVSPVLGLFLCVGGVLSSACLEFLPLPLPFPAKCLEISGMSKMIFRPLIVFVNVVVIMYKFLCQLLEAV